MRIVQKILMLIVFIIVVLVFLEIIPTAPKVKGNNPWLVGEGNAPWVIPHGGAKELYPENTIYSYKEIAKMGYDVFEVDLVLTKDDVLITLHDTTNERFTKPGVNMVIRDHFYDELIKFNYAYNFEKDGKFPYRDLDESDERYKDLRPAKLEELFQQYSDKLFILELKDTVEASGEETFKVAVSKLIELIEKYNMKNKVIVSSFDDDVVNYVRKVSNNTVWTSAGANEVLKFTVLNLLRLNFFYTPRDAALIIPVEYKISDNHAKTINKFPDFLKNQAVIYDSSMDAYYSNIANKRIVRDAHRHNMAVIYWTVNDKAEMKRLIELGVDGIITDRPDLLVTVLAEMGYYDK